jgi:hypothetical protein
MLQSELKKSQSLGLFFFWFESFHSNLPAASPQRVFAADLIREPFPGPPAGMQAGRFLIYLKKAGQVFCATCSCPEQNTGNYSIIRFSDGKGGSCQ